MSCTNIDNTPRAYVAHELAAPEHPGDTETPRTTYLIAVQDGTDPTPLVDHASRARSNRVFNWLVGAGLAILIVMLGAVLLSAASHVEVLP